jgi:hypothetical protein
MSTPQLKRLCGLLLVHRVTWLIGLFRAVDAVFGSLVLVCPEHLQFVSRCWHKLSVAFAGLVSFWRCDAFGLVVQSLVTHAIRVFG